MKLVSFKAEEELLERLDRYALRNRMNRSEVIRLAIEKLLAEDKEDEIPKAKVIKIQLR
ncbi:MAG: ribbon-helix-helix protein, CopG family [Pyrobaculum arsenaticum]|uniref:ribbon-helix-helix protein, CopG family n=1 Tax=Pyrobaculum arsenaticum TaxID=121277 RepID=UPI002272CD8B|nr:ribbon-helix-helix protein, CopG family [Pyrobaculum arsenaticum]